MENKREIYEYMAKAATEDSVSHHGIKGQKWYKRRFQNADGSLTPAGKVRYGVDDGDNDKKTSDDRKNTEDRKVTSKSNSSDGGNKYNAGSDDARSDRDTAVSRDSYNTSRKSDNNSSSESNKFDFGNDDGSGYRKTSGKHPDPVDEDRDIGGNKSNTKLNDKIGTYDTDGHSNRTSEPSVRTKPESKSETKSEPKSEPKPETKSEPKAESKPKPEAKAPGTPETKSVSGEQQSKKAVKDHLAKKEQEDRDKFNKDINAMNNVANVANKAANLTSALKKASDESIKNAPKVKLNLDNMSDAELRNAINRAQLEQQYNDYYAPSTVTKGQQTVNQMLGAITTALAVTGSAVSLAVGIKQLIGK